MTLNNAVEPLAIWQHFATHLPEAERIDVAVELAQAEKDTFYSTAQKTQQVGVAYIYCDGDFTLSGSTSPYFTIVYSSPPCP